MSKRYPGGIIRKTPPTPSQTSAQGIWDMASVTQAVKENTWPIAGVPDPISKSLRFRASASASLSRTPTSTGNRRTFTFSAWVKFGTIGTTNRVLTSCVLDGNNRYQIQISDATADQLTFQARLSSTEYKYWTSSAVFRDPSAWYHIVFAIDTTQATGSDRIKVYVNDVQQSGSNPTTITQNTDTFFNYTVQQNIGNVVSAAYFDGYMTEVYLIDGQALTPSSFGSTNDQTGVWQPIAYTGTYGTNGFYLPFSNTASTTTLGYDFSGNSNNWTPNNISLTSGSTYDSMVDVPTQWIPYNTAGDTGALFRGNYCTWNPLAVGTNITTSNGNLSASASSNSNAMLQGTFGITSGKWYWEVTLSSGTSAWAGSIIKSTAGLNYSSLSSGDAYSYSNDGSKYNGQTSTSYGNTYTTNDVISVAYNADTGKIWYAKNGTWQASGDPAAGTNEAFSGISGTYMPAALLNSATGIANFGAGSGFLYTPPTGFKTLCTTNLSTPTIGATASSQANKYFDISLWTGTGVAQNITNSGSMQPDWVWTKTRSQANDHFLFDAIRGVNNYLRTNSTGAEATVAGNLTAFNSDGFSVGTNNDVNASGRTFVGWQWRGANGTVSNTAGTITSTVSANTTAGFSIVTYTGNGVTGATVGHGLGIAPSMIIVKRRSSTSNWNCYHASLGATKYIVLNLTDASYTDIGAWNNTAPTSSVFTLGSFSDLNTNGSTMVAYCFAQIAGYSAFGSYTGNGSSDGSFVYTGFRPRFLMYKRTDTSGSWVLIDAARGPYNVINPYLLAESSGAEDSANIILDFLSNGFKQRNTFGASNASGGTYIYMAFAESPFKFSLAR